MEYFFLQYGTVQYNILQYSTVQYSTVQYSTVQYSTVQYCTVQYSTVQYSTVQYSTVQYSTVQYSTVQYSTVQYSTVHSTVQSHPTPKVGGVEKEMEEKEKEKSPSVDPWFHLQRPCVKRTQYPAANRVLYHNIIYSKHVVWWFLLNKMDKKDFLFDKYNFLKFLAYIDKPFFFYY